MKGGYNSANAKYYGTGRRKKSVARVYLVPGTGKITINKRDIDEYLGLETLKVIVRQPLVATGTTDKFDVIVNVHGGGYTGQAGAIRTVSQELFLRRTLTTDRCYKSAGFLTRDPRMKERKKYGLRLPVALRSSASAKLYQKWSKTPELRGFRGFSFSNGLTQFDRTKPLLTRFLWVKWWTTTQKEGLWVKK